MNLWCLAWRWGRWRAFIHYGDVIMGTMPSQITSLMIVYSAVYSGTDQRKHQSSASLAFVRGIHRRPVNSPHKRPVTRKKFPFDDVIMCCVSACAWCDQGSGQYQAQQNTVYTYSRVSRYMQRFVRAVKKTELYFMVVHWQGGCHITTCVFEQM